MCLLGRPEKMFGLLFDLWSRVIESLPRFSLFNDGGLLFSPIISFNYWIELLMLLDYFFLRSGIFRKLKLRISTGFSGVVCSAWPFCIFFYLKLTLVKSSGLMSFGGSFSAYFKMRILSAEYEMSSSCDAVAMLSFLRPRFSLLRLSDVTPWSYKHVAGLPSYPFSDEPRVILIGSCDCTSCKPILLLQSYFLKNPS